MSDSNASTPTCVQRKKNVMRNTQKMKTNVTIFGKFFRFNFEIRGEKKKCLKMLKIELFDIINTHTRYPVQ